MTERRAKCVRCNKPDCIFYNSKFSDRRVGKDAIECAYLLRTGRPRGCRADMCTRYLKKTKELIKLLGNRAEFPLESLAYKGGAKPTPVVWEDEMRHEIKTPSRKVVALDEAARAAAARRAASQHRYYEKQKRKRQEAKEHGVQSSG